MSDRKRSLSIWRRISKWLFRLENQRNFQNFEKKHLTKIPVYYYLWHRILWRDGRVVEGARLESVFT